MANKNNPSDRQLSEETRTFLYSKNEKSKRGTKISTQTQISISKSLNLVRPTASTTSESEPTETPCSSGQTHIASSNDKQYPIIKPMFKIKHDYQRYFVYVHHVNGNKILMKCKAPCLQTETETGTEDIKACGQLVSMVPGNYCNLARHLKGKIHQIEVGTAHDNGGITIPGNSQPYGRNHPDQQQFDTNVLSVYADGLPFNFVERKSFVDLVQHLNPKIRVKSRTAYVSKLHRETKKKVIPALINLFNEAPPHSLHFSVDIWTSRRKISALGIKIHFISDDWNHSIKTLALSEFDGAHTGDNIKETFDSILKRFGIHGPKVGLVVSDNASNMKKAFNMVGILEDIEDEADVDLDNETLSEEEDNFPTSSIDPDEFTDSEIEEDDEAITTFSAQTGLGWSPCLAHTLQLSINDSLKSDELVMDLIKDVNTTINFFRRSPKWLAVYRKEIKETCSCEVKAVHELIQPNTTRWNSTFCALDRFAMTDVFKSIQVVINEAISTNTKKVPKPMRSSVKEKIGELARILKPLEVLTNRLQTDYITCNIVIISIVRAYREILKIQTKYFQTFKKTLLNNFKIRMEPHLCNTWFALGAFFDPRQKLKLFKGLQWANDSEKLQLPCVGEIEENLEKEILRDRRLVGDVLDIVEIPKPKKMRTEGLFSLLDEVVMEDPVASELPESILSAEYLKYIEEPLHDESVDPLKFWQLHSGTYKTLSVVAKRVLCIPASSGSVERLFSVAGALGRARRSKTSIKKVEEMILTRESKF